MMLLPLFPIVAISALVGGVVSLAYLASAKNTGSRVVLFASACVDFGASVLLCYLGVHCTILELRKYRIGAEGLYVKDRKESFFSWEQIYKIVISIYDTNGSRSTYKTVICCFWTPPAKYFSAKMAAGVLYGARHTKDFVLIDYDPEVAAELAAYYPGEILDVRKEQLSL